MGGLGILIIMFLMGLIMLALIAAAAILVGIFFTSLIGGIVLLEISSKKLDSKNPDYQYVSKTGIDKKDIPVVNTKNILIRPYKDEDVKILKNFYDYYTANVNNSLTVADLGEDGFYIECMDCIGIDEEDWERTDTRGKCVFSERCIKEGYSYDSTGRV